MSRLPLTPQVPRAGVRATIDHHDMLRLRVDVAADGTWTTRIRPRGEGCVDEVVGCVEHRSLSSTDCWGWRLVPGGFGGGTGSSMPLPHVLDLGVVGLGETGQVDLLGQWMWAGEVVGAEESQRIQELWLAAIDALADHADRHPADGHA